MSQRCQMRTSNPTGSWTSIQGSALRRRKSPRRLGQGRFGGYRCRNSDQLDAEGNELPEHIHDFVETAGSFITFGGEAFFIGFLFIPIPSAHHLELVTRLQL